MYGLQAALHWQVVIWRTCVFRCEVPAWDLGPGLDPSRAEAAMMHCNASLGPSLPAMHA